VSKSKPPRKAYKPKPVGKPMGTGLANKLVLIPHVAVARLIRGVCDGEDAHSLLAFMNVAYRVYEKRGKQDERGELMKIAMETVRDALDIDEELPTLSESDLLAVKTGVTAADRLICASRDHEVKEAISYVWEKVHERETS
jgi:hypothetical protein